MFFFAPLFPLGPLFPLPFLDLRFFGDCPVRSLTHFCRVGAAAKVGHVGLTKKADSRALGLREGRTHLLSTAIPCRTRLAAVRAGRPLALLVPHLPQGRPCRSLGHNTWGVYRERTVFAAFTPMSDIGCFLFRGRSFLRSCLRASSDCRVQETRIRLTFSSLSAALRKLRFQRNLKAPRGAVGSVLAPCIPNR